MYLLFDFELVGVPLTDDAETGLNLLEFRNHVLTRLAELAEDIDQYPEGVVIMNYFSGTHLEGETYQLKAFRFPYELCIKIQNLLTDEDFGIIYENIMFKRKNK